MKRCTDHTRRSLGLLVLLMTVSVDGKAGPTASEADCPDQRSAATGEPPSRMDFERYMEQRGPSNPDPTVHMKELIELAKANRRSALDYCAGQRPPIAPNDCSGGVPFCALIVDRDADRVVARGCNHGSANPIFHGEIAAIVNFSTTLQSQGISFREVARHHDLYTTGESCAMCMGAAMWAGFHTVFFGSSLDHLNQYFSQIMITDHELSTLWRECQGAENTVRTQVVGGVLQAENDALFDEFGFRYCPTATNTAKRLNSYRAVGSISHR